MQLRAVSCTHQTKWKSPSHNEPESGSACSSSPPEIWRSPTDFGSLLGPARTTKQSEDWRHNVQSAQSRQSANSTASRMASRA